MLLIRACSIILSEHSFCQSLQKKNEKLEEEEEEEERVVFKNRFVCLFLFFCFQIEKKQRGKIHF